MIASARDMGMSGREVWEREVLAGHRWGRRGDAAGEELARLRELREAAGPPDGKRQALIEQIVALEICNWNLEGSVLALYGAIGAGEPSELPVGHLASVADERWKKVWAYYLTLRNWLPSGGRSGYQALLRTCDPGGAVRKHILAMLGERDELKELYVERLCLCLECWLGGFYPPDSARMKALEAAVAAVEGEIRKRDAGGEILGAFALGGDGRLQPCHHKMFRRYDIIISSVGAGKWRAAMPCRGTDGFERAAVVEKYLSAGEAWLGGRDKTKGSCEGELFDRVPALLGERDDVKVFLVSLLVSLLRAQQLYAVELAESGTEESGR